MGDKTARVMRWDIEKELFIVVEEVRCGFPIKKSRSCVEYESSDGYTTGGFNCCKMIPCLTNDDDVMKWK